MTRRPILFATALLTFVPTALMAQDVPAPSPPVVAAPTPNAAPGQPVTLKYKYKVGETTRYRFTMTMSTEMTGVPSGIPANPMNMETDETLAQTVQSVRDSDGAATIVINASGLKAEMNGQSITDAMNKGNAVINGGTMTILPSGKVVSASMPTSGSGMPGMDLSKMGTMASAFPDGPVTVGSAWSNDLDLSKILGAAATPAVAMTMSTKSRLTGFEPGPPVIADIHTAYFGGLNGMKIPGAAKMRMTTHMEGDGYTKFNVDDGQLEDTRSLFTSYMSMTVPAGSYGGKSMAPTNMHIVMKMKIQAQRLPDTDSAVLGDAPTPNTAP